MNCFVQFRCRAPAVSNSIQKLISTKAHTAKAQRLIELFNEVQAFNFDKLLRAMRLWRYSDTLLRTSAEPKKIHTLCKRILAGLRSYG